ncbi:thiopeptide-type bacteriocin biosynthesis protein [Nonomuraea endophytica]|uniref:thiopeptide-type bacteriocin biosynthesis protein n=1 Tax=Nonomuraea endophytica TaxID=714136 RepID=UPI0037C91D94
MTSQHTTTDPAALTVDGRRMAVHDFLAACARGLDPAAETAPEDVRLAGWREALLAGGLPAVRSMGTDATLWTQAGLEVTEGRLGAVYAELLRLAGELLSDGATNFFFMHKPPGLRVRVEAPPTLRPQILQVVAERTGGLVASITPACYEPEAHLFGGPVSMTSVHRLFTADSMAWLGFHTAVRPGPAWAFSLVLLRRLFAALGVVGWEDRDVWDRVRRSAGRRLSPGHRMADGFGRAAEGVRRVWADEAALRELISPETAPLIERYTAAVAAEAARWRTAYFDTWQAYVGPREAAAFAIVFHWNRGGLPFARQAFLAEALAS